MGIAAALVLALSACNPTYIDYDYDPDVDFNRFRTFAWYEQTTMTEGTPQAIQMSGLLEARIKRAVNERLETKGLSLVENAPGLLIAYHVGVKNVTEIRSTGYGYGFSGSTRADQFQEGTFILDLIDTSVDKLVWRGTAEGVLEERPTTDQMDRDVDDMIKRLLLNYPPSR